MKIRVVFFALVFLLIGCQSGDVKSIRKNISPVSIVGKHVEFSLLLRENEKGNAEFVLDSKGSDALRIKPFAVEYLYGRQARQYVDWAFAELVDVNQIFDTDREDDMSQTLGLKKCRRLTPVSCSTCWEMQEPYEVIPIIDTKEKMCDIAYVSCCVCVQFTTGEDMYVKTLIWNR